MILMMTMIMIMIMMRKIKNKKAYNKETVLPSYKRIVPN